MTKPSFPDARAAALALLNGDARLTRQAGQFLGQVAVGRTPLTVKQLDWLSKLLARASLPPLRENLDS